MTKQNVKVKINAKAKKQLIDTYSKGSNLQAFVDMSVLRLSAPYTPEDTTALVKSPLTQSKAPIGGGRLLYNAYGNENRNTWNDTTSVFQGAPMRGAFWTVRMLADGGRNMLLRMIDGFRNRN